MIISAFQHLWSGNWVYFLGFILKLSLDSTKQVLLTWWRKQSQFQNAVVLKLGMVGQVAKMHWILEIFIIYCLNTVSIFQNFCGICIAINVAILNTSLNEEKFDDVVVNKWELFVVKFRISYKKFEFLSNRCIYLQILNLWNILPLKFVRANNTILITCTLWILTNKSTGE